MANRSLLEKILADVRRGKIKVSSAYERIKGAPFDSENVGYAMLDHGRGFRLGLGEVIYGEHKSTKQILGIAGKLSASKEPVLVTRLNQEKIGALKKKYPRGRVNALSNTFTVNPAVSKENHKSQPYVCIVTAGTSDIPVAEEAADVCEAMEVAYIKIYDVGVAGIHRVMKNLDAMRNASALVVIAGMEGALPSVIGGMVSKPLFAVPTDVGYGANFRGLSALLGMLASCAPGIAVTNINAGFSAGYAACRVVKEIQNVNSRTRSQKS